MQIHVHVRCTSTNMGNYGLIKANPILSILFAWGLSIGVFTKQLCAGYSERRISMDISIPRAVWIFSIHKIGAYHPESNLAMDNSPWMIFPWPPWLVRVSHFLDRFVFLGGPRGLLWSLWHDQGWDDQRDYLPSKFNSCWFLQFLHFSPVKPLRNHHLWQDGDLEAFKRRRATELKNGQRPRETTRFLSLY